MERNPATEAEIAEVVLGFLALLARSAGNDNPLRCGGAHAKIERAGAHVFLVLAKGFRALDGVASRNALVEPASTG